MKLMLFIPQVYRCFKEFSEILLKEFWLLFPNIILTHMDDNSIWIREQKHRVLLVAPLWKNQHWFSELVWLLTAAPWPIPLRRELLSLRRTESFGTPSPIYRPTSLASRWEPSVLTENVLSTISQARAPSTSLYALKWSVFSTWCTTRGADPEVCDISLILSFLQELLKKGRSPSTLKVYVAAIAASQALIDGQSVGRNNLVVRFLKGSRRLNPPRTVTVPTFHPPFKPLQSVDLCPLTLNTTMLLALA